MLSIFKQTFLRNVHRRQWDPRSMLYRVSKGMLGDLFQYIISLKPVHNPMS
jgi:hypothetical protein